MADPAGRQGEMESRVARNLNWWWTLWRLQPLPLSASLFLSLLLLTTLTTAAINSFHAITPPFFVMADKATIICHYCTDLQRRPVRLARRAGNCLADQDCGSLAPRPFIPAPSTVIPCYDTRENRSKRL